MQKDGGSEPGHRAYILPRDRILFVFDPEQAGIGGKGDMYPREYFERMVQWMERVADDYRLGRGSSISHWQYYSRLKNRLPHGVDQLVTDLAQRIGSSLDLSYKSLDLVSAYIEQIGTERAKIDLYDELVAYVGEVLRGRVDGQWEVVTCPRIRARDRRVLMPINVVWTGFNELEPSNLRALAMQEVRATARHPRE